MTFKSIDQFQIIVVIDGTHEQTKISFLISQKICFPF